MHRSNNEKSKFIFMVLILLVLGIGIGYAVLSERLTVSNYVNYGSMKWDVGFVDAYDAYDGFVEYATGTRFEDDINYLIPVDVSLSSDKKSISINADFGLNTSGKFTMVIATIKNNSTFDVLLTDFGIEESEQVSDFFAKYVEASYYIWFEGFEVDTSVQNVTAGDILRAGETKEILIYYEFYEIDEYNLPTEGANVDISISMDWEQVPDSVISFVVSADGFYTYYAPEGMTWGEWVDSMYNVDNFIVSTSDTIRQENACSGITIDGVPVGPDDIIKSEYDYIIHPC
jgi:hypothetical protein